MQYICLPLGPYQTNAYLLWNESTREAILIDAPHGAEKALTPILKETNLTLKALLITHGHWDHIGNANAIKKMGATVYAHPADQDWIEDASIVNAINPPEFHFESTKIDHFLQDGETLNLIGETFQVRHVPGHCPGNVLFYNKNHHLAFVGDAIFSGSIGRYDLPGGSFKTLKKSIQTQIYTLPDETLLLSGHGPQTSVQIEKSSNPYVKAS